MQPSNQPRFKTLANILPKENGKVTNCKHNNSYKRIAFSLSNHCVFLRIDWWPEFRHSRCQISHSCPYERTETLLPLGGRSTLRHYPKLRIGFSNRRACDVHSGGVLPPWPLQHATILAFSGFNSCWLFFSFTYVGSKICYSVIFIVPSWLLLPLGSVFMWPRCLNYSGFVVLLSWLSVAGFSSALLSRKEICDAALHFLQLILSYSDSLSGSAMQYASKKTLALNSVSLDGES